MTARSRDDVLAHRVHAQQLDRAQGGTVADTAVLDLGVQETGPVGAGRWALLVRGLHDPAEPDLVTAWTLRGAPHTYRRADLPGVAAATRPWSDADAAKRIVDGARPVEAAGIGVLDALDVVAREMQDSATGPTVEGDMSGGLRDRLPGPDLRYCTLALTSWRPFDRAVVEEQAAAMAAARGLTPGGVSLDPPG